MSANLIARLEAAAAGRTDEIGALLRRAVLALRNAESASIDPKWSKALLEAMVDLQTLNPNEAIRYIVGEWLMKNGYISYEELSEDSDTEGSA